MPDPGDVVRAVPDLERMLAAVLETARDLQSLGRGRVDALAHVRLGGRDGEAEVRAREHVDPLRAQRAGRRLPLGLAEHDDRAGRDPPPASRLRSARASRRARRCGRARRWSGRPRGRRARSSRRSRPPSPASTTATSTSLAANSARPAAVSTSNCVAPAACGRTRARARSRSASRAVDLDPLRPAAHVRRDVRADAQPRRVEQRRAHQRRRRLAVRADDVDRGKRALRLAERGEQRPHAAEPELLGPRRERFEPADVCVLPGHDHGSVTAVRLRGRRYSPSASRSRLKRASFSRSASTSSGGAFGGEALVREHALGAGDLLAQPPALGLDVAVRLSRAPA